MKYVVRDASGKKVNVNSEVAMYLNAIQSAEEPEKYIADEKKRLHKKGITFEVKSKLANLELAEEMDIAGYYAIGAITDMLGAARGIMQNAQTGRQIVDELRRLNDNLEKK
ncbi:MAG: hypothetical protein GXY77_17275 [Fibrobacter sp.]|nr:hypothetical protein [Fibrobacter sp.]